jgi:hypothetical protein
MVTQQGKGSEDSDDDSDDDSDPDSEDKEVDCLFGSIKFWQLEDIVESQNLTLYQVFSLLSNRPDAVAVTYLLRKYFDKKTAFSRCAFKMWFPSDILPQSPLLGSDNSSPLIGPC